MIVIRLTRLNREEYYLNPDLIDTIETMPDTTITTLNGRKLVVLESVEEVVERIIAFKGRVRSYQKTE